MRTWQRRKEKRTWQIRKLKMKMKWWDCEKIKKRLWEKRLSEWKWKQGSLDEMWAENWAGLVRQYCDNNWSATLLWTEHINVLQKTQTSQESKLKKSREITPPYRDQTNIRDWEIPINSRKRKWSVSPNPLCLYDDDSMNFTASWTSLSNVTVSLWVIGEIEVLTFND